VNQTLFERPVDRAASAAPAEFGGKCAGFGPFTSRAAATETRHRAVMEGNEMLIPQGITCSYVRKMTGKASEIRVAAYKDYGQLDRVSEGRHGWCRGSERDPNRLAGY